MKVNNGIPEGVHDMIIIGGGPAGLTAGLYAARGRMDVLLLESLTIMGQVTMTDLVENYPGIEKASGFEIISSFKKQAEAFGLRSRQGTVKKVSFREEGDIKVWQVGDENGVCEALSVLIASGARPKKLRVPGEEEFLGKGISYCATCDAAFFREKDIIVVGGGDTAVEEALFLTRFGKKVTLLHRRDRLRATRILQERAFANDKMDFIWDSVVEEIAGGEKVDGIKISNVKTGEKNDVPCEGVFIYVGWDPNTDFIEGGVEMDRNGHVIVDLEMKTSQEGIFAGGDCCKKHLHQIVTACGDGATAAFSAQRYVEEIKGMAYK
ncbi:MAG: thioredoxin-disulfide reductase [Candidatus Omnitrophota bacterium]|nr:thioredoxin-disulfide reductase [Candidatus Omnitrophota bacterium]